MKKMNMRQRNYQTIMKNERFYWFHQSIHHIYAFKRNKEKINMKWTTHFHIFKYMKKIFILNHQIKKIFFDDDIKKFETQNMFFFFYCIIFW
jgi:hypothetical protein